LFAPDADSRRVIEALLTTQPQVRPHVTEGVLTKGLQWAALAIQAPPQLSLDLHIESADAASATALADTIGRILQSVGKIPILDEISPNLSETLGELVLGVSGNTLRLTLDATQSTRLIADVVVPPLSRTRALARQMTCATHLRQIGMSMLMYANDNDDKFPPNLEILVDEADLPPVVLTCSEGPAYVYRGVDLPGVAAPPGLITVHDPPGAHPGGRNVLYVDTHVDFVHEDRFAEAIAKDNEQRRSLGIPEKPAQ
jgi:prepilin-type processing-associated H-X9-DG protein